MERICNLNCDFQLLVGMESVKHGKKIGDMLLSHVDARYV
jgi:hypothetical protein